MSRFLYTCLHYLALPLILIRLAVKSLAASAYRQRWGERFGWFPATRPGGLWIHAVSVGETMAALPLVKMLQEQYPELPVTVTTTTPTGSDLVRKQLGDQVHHVYAPYDLPGCLRRFLTRVRPRLLVIMETELWPNLIHACNTADIPVLVVNARLSAHSARGYGRVGKLTRTMLDGIDCIACQNPADARRFAVLGMAADRLQVTGSIKYDLVLPEGLESKAREMRNFWPEQAPVWIAGSTHKGEDEQILAAHREVQKSIPDARLILVPRHPERFRAVAELCREGGALLATRTDPATWQAEARVLLVDTMGELLAAYAAADLAFVGGSLVATGGHNAMEPAAMARPVLTGPHIFNFADLYRQLLAAGAARIVKDPGQLARAVGDLLADPLACRSMGEAGRQVIQRNRGALARTFDLVSRYRG